MNLATAFADDDDFILSAIYGLPSEYDSLKTTIRAQLGTITMEQVTMLLCSKAIRVESKSNRSSTDLNVAFAATCGSSFPCGFPTEEVVRVITEEFSVWFLRKFLVWNVW